MSASVLLYVRGLEEGGAEKQVERLACGLDRARFRIAVAYSYPWGIVGDRLRRAGIPLLQIPPRDQDAAERVIRAFAPDIFHSFTHTNAVDIVAATGAHVPAIVSSRVNVREWDEFLKVRDWERVRNRKTHRITAVSHAAAVLCEKVEGVAAQNIVVIHNGVPIPEAGGRGRTIRDELGIGPEVQTIGYVANYRAEKDHETLLRSFRLVLGRRPDTHLICCGIALPRTRARLAGLVREMGLGRRVSLLESRSNVDPVYRGLDLYVHSSRFEGFSNSVLEAMAHGLPVVATDAGGNPEAIVVGVTGLLVPCGKPEAFADAVVALLGDAVRRESFGKAGRARVERHFSVGAMVEGYARFYEEVSQDRIGCGPRSVGDNSRLRVLFHLDCLDCGERACKLALGLDRGRFEPVLPAVHIATTHGNGRADAVRQIRDLAPDIFHSFSGCRSSADVLNARAAGVPFVVTSRCQVRADPGDPPHAWERERNLATDRIVACSHAVAASCTDGEDIPREKMTVILDGEVEEYEALYLKLAVSLDLE